MSLIVEDGTGLDTAESYVSVVDAGTYCTAHGLTAWTGTDGVKESALRNATQYIDTMYNFRSAKSYYSSGVGIPAPNVGLGRRSANEPSALCYG